MKVSVERRGRFPAAALPPAAFLSRLVPAVFRSERARVKGDVSVVFVDRAGIRKLNRTFLNESGDTDVIAFPYEPGLAGDGPFGDVYVAVPVAHENARRFGDTPERELIRLVIHGLLHLLGHDDHKPAARRIMWERQERLVERHAPRRRSS